MDTAQLATALDLLDTLDPGRVFAHHMSVFISIAEAGSLGAVYADLEERHGLSNAGVSRSVNALIESARHRKTSLGLVEINRDAEEGRRHRVKCTKKGESFYRALQGL